MVYLSIFFVSFLAATILPFSSEVGLASLLSLGIHNNILLLLFASFGNILGSCVNWLLGISPEGIGFVGMLINFAIAFIVSSVTNNPPKEINEMVENIRKP